MFSNFSEGIAIATYNRSEGLKESLTAVFDTKPDGARVIGRAHV